MRLNWPIPSELPALSAKEVHVWTVALDNLPACWSALESVLSHDEQVRAAGFEVDKARRTFVASRAALRQLLGHYLAQAPADVQIALDLSGKPQLVDSDLRFNLAHSGKLVLIGITRNGQIGVDVEQVRSVDRSLEIAARNFHPAELEAIRAANAAQLPATFLRCWTRKEAVIKAIGLGFGYPLDAFSVASNHLEEAVRLPANGALPPMCVWRYDLQPCEGYCAAIATTSERPTPLGFTYSL